MSERIPKHKAIKLLEQAQYHLARREFERAEALLRDVSRSELKLPAVAGFLGDALAGQGREDEALQVWSQALATYGDDPELNARVGTQHARRGRLAEALPFLQRSQADRRKDWGTLIHLGHVLIQAGRIDDAERALTKAVATGGGAEAKIVLALLRGRQGRYADAERLCIDAEQTARSPQVLAAATGMRADARLLQGDAAGALERWKALREKGGLDPIHLGHMAYAAQLAGDPALSDELVAARSASGATAEDLLLFAEIANLRSQPERALELLDASGKVNGERQPGHAFEVSATRGRALRLLGRRDEATALLWSLAAAPEAASARLGPKVHVDLGHLAAEEGDFEEADLQFRAALALDPAEPEAQHGLQLTGRRVAWREELSASAEARVEAAKAEAEAMRRRFSAREGELEALRAELERLRSAQKVAEEKARRAEEEAKVAAERSAREAEAAHKQKVREELIQREHEAEEKARENVERALGPALTQCPRAVLDAFLVAEKTYQKALFTDLPAAAVAVLYTGALERALFTFFVEHFRVWLREKGRLAELLKGAVRERRGTRVDYFDHFVEAFDEERPGRAPSMGEVGRVLERRKEPYLRPFLQFIEERWTVEDAFFDGLAAFVQWSKEILRDPVAHGRGDSVSYEQLRTFRERILKEEGMLAALVSRAPRP